MNTRSTNGFTLVEMAIVLAIIALVLGASLSILSTQQDQQRINDTNTLLSDARDSLIGYALAKTPPYLPCPDKTTAAGEGTANDGQEDRTAATGACVAQEGNLPWVTLGLTPQKDAWGNRPRYTVTAAFSNRLTGMQLTSVGTLNVYDSAAAASSVATTVPAIILSHGKNGYSATNSAGNINAAPPSANTDEIANQDGNATFVSHSITFAKDNLTGVEFDDQVIWLSQYTLFNRMVQAGKLP